MTNETSKPFPDFDPTKMDKTRYVQALFGSCSLSCVYLEVLEEGPVKSESTDQAKPGRYISDNEVGFAHDLKAEAAWRSRGD
jgi:hypothetical protein